MNEKLFTVCMDDDDKTLFQTDEEREALEQELFDTDEQTTEIETSLDTDTSKRSFWRRD